MIKETIKLVFEKMKIVNIYINEKKSINKKMKLVKTVDFTKEQNDKIDNIWIKNYGKKISKDWHKLYTSYTGTFDELYFPEIFFTTNLLDKLNPPYRRQYLSDKILTSYFFKNIENEKYKVPKIYVYNCNGYFYDDNRNNKL